MLSLAAPFQTLRFLLVMVTTMTGQLLFAQVNRDVIRNSVGGAIILLRGFPTPFRLEQILEALRRAWQGGMHGTPERLLSSQNFPPELVFPANIGMTGSAL